MSRFPTFNLRDVVATSVVALSIATAAVATCSISWAQQPGGSFDPAQLPETKGRVTQYTLTPRGDIDGLILVDGTEVKLPPHLSAQTAYSIKLGDSVTIHGLRAFALPLVSALSIANDASGQTIVDNGGPGAERGAPETTITGKVARALHGPAGDVNGALLEDGTNLRLPPPEAARWTALLQPGQTLSARGVIYKTALGSVMEASALGATPDQLSFLAAPPPPPGPMGGPGGPPPGPPPQPGAFAPPPPPPPGMPAAPQPGALPPPPPHP